MPQNNSVSFFAPGFDDTLEQQKIERQRKLAESMLQQSQARPKGQMVGQIYVPPSWTEGLANVMQAYQSGKMGRDADEKQTALAQAMQDRNKQELTGFAEALRGKPAIPEQNIGSSPERNLMMGEKNLDLTGQAAPDAMIPAQEATPGDPQRALALALQAKNPGLQSWGMSQMMPKTPKWEKAEMPQPDGTKKTGFVDVNSPNPWSTFQLGGTAPVKLEAVNTGGNTTFVNPFAPKVDGAPTLPATANEFKDVVKRDPSGAIVPNAPLVAVKKDIAKSGASNTQVSVNTATKPFLNEIGKGVGEQVVNDFAGARSAQQTLNNVDQIENGLKNVIVGPGSGVRVKLSQLGQVLGVNGKDATEQLQNTRQVMQGLARQELAAAGQMKGQGQITESERAILRKAESGQIDELTVPEIQTLTGALRKTSQYRIGVHAQNMERLKKDPNAAGVADYMALPNVGNQGGGSVLDAADAILRGGK